MLSVNGYELKTSDNLWRVLNLVTGRKFEFKSQRQTAKRGFMDDLSPLDPLDGGSQAELEWLSRWVDSRGEMVDKLSDLSVWLPAHQGDG